MKLIIGNWKMEPQTLAEARKLAGAIAKKARTLQSARTVICPPFVFLEGLKKMADNAWCLLGAQDVFWEERGSHTGEISAFMLEDAKVKYILIGHSERRALGETDEMVNKKTRTALAHNFTAVVCVGERVRDEDGAYLRFVEDEIRQAFVKVPKDALSRVVIAYEPVWAVGPKAFRADTPEELFEMVIFIRKIISKLFGANAAHAMRVLYGGSVDEKNAEGFLAKGKADGLLVGRASLDAKKFGKILEIAEKQ
ncbi:MAG: triose-phosphate isomerase [Parcubacteria group bacterium]|nr:triose-phosphate isomerase [Parcubacteria group bacterium]MBI2049036.1 triose-phosphate isomerase [Parcubacteria group bacterium]